MVIIVTYILKSQGTVMDLPCFISELNKLSVKLGIHILEASKPPDVGHVFPASRVRPMHLSLRESRALQESNITFVAPSTSSEVYSQTRITFGFIANCVMRF